MSLEERFHRACLRLVELANSKKKDKHWRHENKDALKAWYQTWKRMQEEA